MKAPLCGARLGRGFKLRPCHVSLEQIVGDEETAARMAIGQ
jgi:hypothetical protein